MQFKTKIIVYLLSFIFIPLYRSPTMRQIVSFPGHAPLCLTISSCECFCNAMEKTPPGCSRGCWYCFCLLSVNGCLFRSLLFAEDQVLVGVRHDLVLNYYCTTCRICSVSGKSGCLCISLQSDRSSSCSNLRTVVVSYDEIAGC